MQTSSNVRVGMNFDESLTLYIQLVKVQLHSYDSMKLTTYNIVLKYKRIRPFTSLRLIRLVFDLRGLCCWLFCNHEIHRSE